MARSIWKGSITFGLITIPVKLFTAVGRQDEKLDFHLLHEKDSARIHYDRVCEKGHRDVDWSEIVRGHEYKKGHWITISDEEMEALDLDTLRAVDVVNFSPQDQIDPVMYDKTYYIVPEEAGVKAYRLLQAALEDEGLVGVCKVALRDRERLAAVRVKDNLLALETMHWPEEIRSADQAELRKRPKVADREVKMARQLIQQLTEDFDPSRFKDEYHKALKKLVDKKIKGEEIVVQEEPEEEPAGVVDLMEALRASVEQARSGGSKKTSGRKKTSRGRSTKKSTARKSSKKTSRAQKSA